jgi:hypothetical protein
VQRLQNARRGLFRRELKHRNGHGSQRQQRAIAAKLEDSLLHRFLKTADFSLIVLLILLVASNSIYYFAYFSLPITF